MLVGDKTGVEGYHRSWGCPPLEDGLRGSDITKETIRIPREEVEEVQK